MMSLLQRTAKRAKDLKSSLFPPSRSWHAFVQILLLLLLFPGKARSEVAPVEVRAGAASAWTGQRLPFFVDLRTRGSFSGSAAFVLPDIPRTIMMKLGNPVVSSMEIEGESWFVQTHEFALFSQESGPIDIPAFEVRFSSRDGFTGPVTDNTFMTPPARVEIRRPPGTEKLGFLMTTESLDLTETWDPLPEAAEVGTVFKRTIVQRAGQMTGMALAPAPTGPIPGIRIYPGQPTVRDKTDRGTFVGERLETITYLLQEPGTLELPALTYLWWNPKSEELQSQTLPAVTIEVAPAKDEATTATAGDQRRWWPWLLAAFLTATLAAWQRSRLASGFATLKTWLNPPERVAARALLRACRAHDPAAAQQAWNQWRNTQDSTLKPGPDLGSAVLGLQRVLFGPAPGDEWTGAELSRAFSAHRHATRTTRPHQRSSTLPPLNTP